MPQRSSVTISPGAHNLTLPEAETIVKAAAEAVNEVTVAIENAAKATIAPMAAAGLDATDPALRRPAAVAHLAYRWTVEALVSASEATDMKTAASKSLEAISAAALADEQLEQLSEFINEWTDLQIDLKSYSIAAIAK